MSKFGNRKLYFGTCGWKYRDWHGSFYPDQLESENYLKFYSQFFNSVEVEESFFGIPPTQKVSSWYAQTPKQFRFSVKLSRQISHEHRFQNCQSLIEKFYKTFALLKEKLGVVLILLPSNFQQKNIGDLIRCLEREILGSFQVAIEFSNQLWKKTEAPAFFKAKNISVVQTNLGTIEEPLGAFLYFRWKGSSEYQNFTVEQRDCQDELNIWKLRFGQLSGRVNTIYGYFSNQYSGFAPNSCQYFSSLWKPTEPF